ncbi:MAG: YicC/YloC family endoribonuclease [Deferrisomatales bacterium]|nr:YicC/YloC family endoribonuclease [Deferrisomatales bacterium]
MIKSMTGYGRAEGEIGGRRLAVEVKAVNHRFLNVLAKLPPDLQRFETELLALVKGRLQRGQVNLFAAWDGRSGAGMGVYVSVEAAREAARALRAAADASGVPAEVTLDHLLAIPAVTSPGGGGMEAEALWVAAAPLFGEALEALDALRLREGEDLAADLRGRLHTVGGLIGRVEQRRPAQVEEVRSRLGRRVQDLAQELPPEVATERIAFEVALFADRSDVSEEVVRLRSHLAKVLELLAEGGVVGRKLDFLLQEMNREVNTIGSKASDAEIGRLVVEMKAELEKVREQVQNIE